MITMGANGISDLPTKEEKQVAKLDIAQSKREGRVVADDGSVSGSVDPSKNYYRARNQYNISQLPTRYTANNLTDNANVGGLIEGRPWVESGVAVPTYSLTRSASSINEGQSVTITLNTTNVANGTVIPYTITGVSSSDINGASLTGNFVVGTTDDITLTSTEDSTTEGNEILMVTLDGIGESVSVTIVDTSITPVLTYEFTTYPTLILEGSDAVFDVSTTNVADGTTLYWTIAADGSTVAGDFVNTSGSFTVTSGVGSFTITTIDDSTVEGSETFTVELRTGSIAGTVRDTTDTITIFETITDTPIATSLESQFDASIGANFVPTNPADGDTFTQWTENNAGVRNANPIGGAVTRTSYETNEANTLSVVRFDGVNDGLSINPYPGLASKAGVTVFVVAKMAAETVSENNLNPRVFSTNVANGIALYYNSTSNLWTVAGSSGIGESTQTNESTLFKMHTLVYDGTQTGNSNRLKYRYNGVQDTLTFTGTVGTTTSASITTLYIGNNNSANYWKGDIGELLLFTRTLTANEILGVEAYLTEKWGL